MVWCSGKMQVYAIGNGYILHNASRPFAEAHTHLRTLEQCKMIAEKVRRNEVPHTGSIYLLISALRVSTDPDYQEEIKRIIERKKHKQKYIR